MQRESKTPIVRDSIDEVKHINQRDLVTNLCKAAQERRKLFIKNTPEIWARASAMAQSQPFVTAVDAPMLAQMQQQLVRLQSVADNLVVIGTGGSSLGAQALCGLRRESRVHFIDNCDATTIRNHFAQLPPERTAWMVISKSGKTIETLATTLALLAHYDTVATRVALSERILVITSETAQPLRMLATQEVWETLPHQELGGRYCVFSAAGLLPAAFAGIDMSEVLAAARDAWIPLLALKNATLFEAASCFAASIPDQPIHVLMAYGDCLRPLTQWYKQLWGESLGKYGAGPTPATAIGSLDQHSQLQLYLDGPRDKLFTVIIPVDASDPLQLADCSIEGTEYLRGQTMQHVMRASAEATYETFVQHAVPVRRLITPLDVCTLSALMVRMMLETMLVAAMLDVDPFDQPAVEEGKQRARKALGQPH